MSKNTLSSTWAEAVSVPSCEDRCPRFSGGEDSLQIWPLKVSLHPAIQPLKQALSILPNAPNLQKELSVEKCFNDKLKNRSRTNLLCLLNDLQYIFAGSA